MNIIEHTLDIHTRHAVEEAHTWAKDAVPIDDDDYGSDRQIDAQNAFYDAAFQILDARDQIGLWNAVEDYALKATAEEGIAFALAAIDGEVTPDSHPWVAQYLGE